ncbi:hypothetical protein C1141_20680, partial [Vibrio agarivorans]
PLLVALKKEYKDCHITLFSKHQITQTLVDSDFANKFVCDKGWSPIKTAWYLKGFNLAFNLRKGSLRTDLSLLMAGSPLSYKQGGSLWDKLIYKERLQRYSAAKYVAKKHIDLVNYATNKNFETNIISPESQEKEVNDKFSIYIVPCGSEDAKKWPIKKYVNFAEELSRVTENANYVFHFILGPTEVNYSESIPNSIGG